MKIKPIYKIIACFIFSLLFVYVLLRYSFNFNHSPNNFIRLFPPHATDIKNTLDLQSDHYFIAGVNSDKIYLASSADPMKLLILSPSLHDSSFAFISLSKSENINLAGTQIKIDSPYFFLTDRIAPAIYRGILGQWHASRFMYDSGFFLEAVPISSSSFALSAVSRNPYENI